MNPKICEHCPKLRYYYRLFDLNGMQSMIFVSMEWDNEKHTLVNMFNPCCIRTYDKKFIKNWHNMTGYLPFQYCMEKARFHVSNDCPYHLEHQMYDWNNYES